MITILTPTYNRAYRLPDLYESLKKQNGLFEWLIIDDGSIDETASWVKSISEHASFNIRYIYQENQGKHIALNNGVANAFGDWIFIVDSDDYLCDHAIEIMTKDILEYGATYELCYRKTLVTGQMVGNQINESKMVMSTTQASHVLKGDLAYLFKTSSMRQFPFPYISTEKFVPELYIWNKISDHFPILFFTKQSIYFCEYLADGYSKQFKEHLRKNPIGFLLFYRDQLKRERSLIQKLKCMIRTIQCIMYLK